MSSTLTLFITVALGVSAVGLALEIVFIFKTNFPLGLKQLAVLALFTVGALVLYDKLPTPNRSYYDYLSRQARLSFVGVVVALSISGSCLLELTRLIHEQGRRAIQGARGAAYVLGFSLGLIGSCLILQTAAATLVDMLTEPIPKTGTIQEAHLWTGTTTIFGGLVTVDDTIFRLPNLSWFHSLSVGQVVQFVYSLHTHYAFPSNAVALTPVGLFPMAIISIDAVVLPLWTLHSRTGVLMRSGKKY